MLHLFKKADWVYYRSYIITLLPLVISLLLVLGAVAALELSAAGVVLLGLLVLAGAVGTTWLAGVTLRRFMKPPMLLARAMRRLMRGQNQVRVREISAGEMGELERGFNAMSARISQINEELQREISKATAEATATLEALEIRNAELDIARKDATEANRLKSDFLANMSHEIRTPMNGIIGFSDLLSRTELQEHQTEYVTTIRQSAESLLSIIDDILEFAALESGQLALQQAPFSLRQAIEHAVRLNVPSAHEKHLELVALVYTDVPDQLLGDAPRIVQVLANLLSNAVKFTAAGDVVLRVMLENDDEDDNITLGFTVSDTGIGIPLEEQKLMFEAFRQSGLSAKRVFGGAGLGLTLCRIFAQAMGGHIEVSSLPGEGTTVHVSIRLQLNREASTVQAIGGSIGKRALLIEPNNLSRIVLRNTLAGIGIAVSEYEHAPDIGTIDLSLFNLAILGTGSFDEQVRQTQKLTRGLSSENLPVLVLASTSNPEMLQAFRRAGALASLSKPTPEPTLEKAVRRVIGHKTAALADATPVIAETLLTGKNCLAADDNPINLSLVAHFIEDMGGTAIPAENGAQAVHACRTQRIDMAFLDVHMPIMSGLEAATEIRKMEGNSNLPMIALTADIAEQNSRELERSAFDGWLPKPVTAEQLQHTVQALLNGAAPQDSPAAVLPSINISAASAGQASLPTYDREQALRIAGGSEAVARKLYTSLLNELPAALLSIHRSFESGQLGKMWDETHRLHGAVAVCAVPALHQALSQLQSVIRLEDREQIVTLLAEVQNEANRLVESFASQTG